MGGIDDSRKLKNIYEKVMWLNATRSQTTHTSHWVTCTYGHESPHVIDITSIIHGIYLRGWAQLAVINSLHCGMLRPWSCRFTYNSSSQIWGFNDDSDGRFTGDSEGNSTKLKHTWIAHFFESLDCLQSRSTFLNRKKHSNNSWTIHSPPLFKF